MATVQPQSGTGRNRKRRGTTKIKKERKGTPASRRTTGEKRTAVKRLLQSQILEPLTPK